jgi:CDP-diacylglycerol--glycerol-3-phosphate 3-phosphatidyltransferase
VGPRLDTAADVMLYVCLIVGGAWLTWDALQTELLFLILGVASYAISIGAALWNVRRFPAYHTRAAKTCWLLILVGSVLLFTTGATWMMRIALVAVALTNLEAALISVVLPEPATNVPSLWHAVQRRKRTAEE